MDLTAPIKTTGEEAAAAAVVAETVLEVANNLTSDVPNNEDMVVDTNEAKKPKYPSKTNETESNESVNSTNKNPTENINGGGGTAYASLKSLTYYKSLSDKIRKFGSSYVFKQENIKSYTDTFGIDYKIGGQFAELAVSSNSNIFI